MMKRLFTIFAIALSVATGAMAQAVIKFEKTTQVTNLSLFNRLFLRVDVP